MNERLKNLVVRLLDDEDGITESAYKALLDILPDDIVLAVNKQVEATEGRYYLPEDHTLRDWLLLTGEEKNIIRWDA